MRDLLSLALWEIEIAPDRWDQTATWGVDIVPDDADWCCDDGADTDGAQHSATCPEYGETA